MVMRPVSSSHLLVLSHDVVEQHMAGPGIRYLELARALRSQHPVTLGTPNPCTLEEPGIRFHPYRFGAWESLAPVVEGASVIITSAFLLASFPELLALPVPIVIDLYDPFPLENLLLFAGHPEAERQRVFEQDQALLAYLCQRGDFFVCAHARQRDWWLGVLQAKGRVNPLTMAQDPTLRALIDEVPFGLPSRPFQGDGAAVRQALGLSERDRLILWGGGLWEWLDPLTAIRAMPAILEAEPHARLLFPGTRHPNAGLAEMPILREAIALADELGLRDRAIFFGEWVAYDDWPDYLAAADVALSLHHDSLETRFCAVRSRILSYIWARLPMVVSEGDAASELVATQGLGEVVSYQDGAGVARALLAVLQRGPAPYQAAFTESAAQLTWERVAAPLLAFCAAPQRAADHAQLVAEERASQAQIEQLQQRVAAYERGRFMRLMRTVDQLKQKVRALL